MVEEGFVDFCASIFRFDKKIASYSSFWEDSA
jgi:hypothetical protein